MPAELMAISGHENPAAPRWLSSTAPDLALKPCRPISHRLPVLPRMCAFFCIGLACIHVS